jgi:hypothetical protein
MSAGGDIYFTAGRVKHCTTVYTVYIVKFKIEDEITDMMSKLLLETALSRDNFSHCQIINLVLVFWMHGF